MGEPSFWDKVENIALDSATPERERMLAFAVCALRQHVATLERVSSGRPDQAGPQETV